MSRTNKSGKQGGMDGLTTLTRQLEQVKAQARALGIFTDDRELLECPNCGLLEDVTAKGLLVTEVRDQHQGGDLMSASMARTKTQEGGHNIPKADVIRRFDRS